MGKYNSRSIARRLDFLRRQNSRQLGSETVQRIWTNGEADIGGGGVVPFNSQTLFFPLIIPTLRIQYARITAIHSTTPAYLSARIYELTDVEQLRQYPNDGRYDHDRFLRAITPLTNSNAEIGTSAELVTFDFGKNYTLPSSRLFFIAIRSEENGNVYTTGGTATSTVITPGTIAWSHVSLDYELVVGQGDSRFPIAILLCDEDALGLLPQ